MTLFSDSSASRTGHGRSWSPPRSGHPDADRLVLAGLVAAAALVALVLGTGHLSAFVFDGGWPRYRLADAPGVVARVAAALDDPGRAWDPVNRGAAPPGPLAWWATLALLAGVPAAGVARRRRRARQRPAAAAWATTGQLRRLRVRRPGGRLIVGTAGGRLLAVEARHSMLVLGPTQTGKTSGLAIPAILEWPGPVVATSTKADLVADTIAWRSTLGDVFVYDPAACTTFPRSGWTPLAGCDTWGGATRAAWELTRAAKSAVGNSMALAEFWFGAGAKALAPLLLAAARSGRTLADVARWVDREEVLEPLTVLRRVEPDAAIAHEATFRREERGRSSLIQVMQAAVGAYLDPVVAASAERSDIAVPRLLDGGAHTLYVTAPHDEQERFRTLFTALISQVITAAYRRAGGAGKPLDPPVLLVLDEAANIAPVDDLPTVAATAAAMGLQVVTVFQDLAQIRRRYGNAAGTVVNNHRAKLLLPAVSDLDTLDLASRLIGDEEVERPSVTTDSGGRRSSTSAAHWRRLLPPESARGLDDGSAVLLYGNLPPALIRLRFWFSTTHLRRRARHAKRPERVSPPPAGAAAPSPNGDTANSVSILEAARARRRATGAKP